MPDLCSLPPAPAGKKHWPWTTDTTSAETPDKLLPLISIITPSYNQGQYLEETIRSVIAQRYPNYELIIIDAGSTDNTLDVIRLYEPWITYWVSEKDRGQSHAIQKGLVQVKGDIVNWINSDDLVAPGAFYRIAAEFDLNRYDVICGRCDYFTGDITQLDMQGMRMKIEKTVGDTINRQQINQPSTFFKASVLKELGVDEQFRYTMDMDLWFRYLLLAGQEKILLSEGLFSYFRLHEASKTVAEGAHFTQDIQKVFYNILHSTDQPVVLLTSVRRTFAEDSSFKPTRYSVGITPKELAAFLQHQAWLAVHRYNKDGEYTAARQCLALARQLGQSMNWSVVKQFIRLYLLPKSLLRQSTIH